MTDEFAPSVSADMSFLHDARLVDAIFNRFDYCFFAFIFTFLLLFWRRIVRFLTILFWYSYRLSIALIFALVIQGALFFTPPYQFVRKIFSGAYGKGDTKPTGGIFGNEL